MNVEIKEQLPQILTDNQKQIDQTIQQIIKIASKELVATKIPAPTNAKRKKKHFKPTNSPSNSSRDSKNREMKLTLQYCRHTEKYLSFCAYKI